MENVRGVYGRSLRDLRISVADPAEVFGRDYAFLLWRKTAGLAAVGVGASEDE